MEATCKIKSDIDNVTQSLAKNLLATKDDIEQTAHKGVADIERLREKALKLKDQLYQKYRNASWRRKRPDIAFLAELLFIGVIGAIGYVMLPYLTTGGKPGFSPAQFKRAKNLPAGAFSIEQMAQVRLEAESYKNYHAYFAKGSAPYSFENSGMNDMILSQATLPIIMFAIQYILPPFVIAYILWFIIRYWTYVWAASWGGFMMLYKYFTDLIQGQLGCKWYIRMVTRWKCRRPSFYKYFSDWRRKFIDRPLYYEQLYYVKQFEYVKNEYVKKPYQKYVVEPLEQLQIEAQYAKQVYFDRTIEVLLRILRGNKDATVNKLANFTDRGKQLTRQALGQPYTSTTETIGSSNASQEEDCDCPAEPTVVGAYFARLKEQTDAAQRGLSQTASAVTTAFKNVNKLISPKAGSESNQDNQIQQSNKSKFSCQDLTKVRAIDRYLFPIIAVITVICIIGGIMYSRAYGTPFWIQNLFGASKAFVHQGTKLVSVGYSWANPLAYLGALCALILLFMVK